jgi:murein DD-endopeptidase MepM/ murein hydrolase activator NlpD
MSLPVSGSITSNFGWRKHPITGKNDFHNGVDISCSIGTPVKTLFGGKMIKLSNDSSRGLYIIMKNNNKEEHFYHLSKFRTPMKELYSPGDIIAYSGNTGSSTGPHLHYGIKLEGSFVNPIDYLGFIETTGSVLQENESNKFDIFGSITNFGITGLIYISIIALLIFSIFKVYKINYKELI